MIANSVKLSTLLGNGILVISTLITLPLFASSTTSLTLLELLDTSLTVLLLRVLLITSLTTLGVLVTLTIGVGTLTTTSGLMFLINDLINEGVHYVEF